MTRKWQSRPVYVRGVRFSLGWLPCFQTELTNLENFRVCLFDAGEQVRVFTLKCPVKVNGGCERAVFQDSFNEIKFVTVAKTFINVNLADNWSAIVNNQRHRVLPRVLINGRSAGLATVSQQAVTEEQHLIEARYEEQDINNREAENRKSDGLLLYWKVPNLSPDHLPTESFWCLATWRYPQEGSIVERH